MTTRREVLETLGVVGAGAVGFPRLPRNLAALGNAHPPVGPLGVQLYTLRSLMAQNVEETLAAVAGIGYTEVELHQYFGRSPAQLRSTLDDNGLISPSGHIPVESLGEGWDRLLEGAATIGHKYVVVAWMPESMRSTMDDWKRTAELFNRAGERALDFDMRFAYHNHDFEFQPLDGHIPLHFLCEETDPRLVDIELDLFWIIHGGGDPVAFIDQWPGRIPMVHVKDRTAGGDMVDVGAGVIDWRGIFAKRAKAGIRHYFIEHDNPPDPLGSVRESFVYMSRLEI